ncbi:hypothetical protein H310_14201 [Aphanomyces invadans]|uniref:PH domain-containing protein n=1 Tax=Aphanomyces invadans TaxID=157072 RepID=A0A024TC73_9STRA|nr:hypothetical protein H310_14201 [Aphanomyces invadans]ETV91201.1 hypothetical protein H310_14201 [Aphanomyces invadans]RHY22479.1 hypothetical protein DYB32_009493 [Aphanomyces invadans]|eukprot:XP_008880232.1 hypothetical protein H310_14201 [Aphanomyces invadans]
MAFKTGTLYKKGSGNGFFKRYDWTPRHCILTSTALHYFTCQDGALKGSIDLTECTLQSLEVMPADCPKTGRSVATGWRIAIQTPTQRYFIAAPSERDMHEWLHALKIAVKLNELRWLQSATTVKRAIHFTTPCAAR